MKTFLEGKALRRGVGLFTEILAGEGQLVPYIENLMGENAAGLEHLGVGEYAEVAGARFEGSFLTIDWVGVGTAERVYEKDPVWGQAPSETLPCLRFNRAADHVSEFFDEGEPYEYRVLFRRTTEGLRCVAIERLVEGEGQKAGAEWQVCDLDTSYLILVALHDLLPRLNQHGE